MECSVDKQNMYQIEKNEIHIRFKDNGLSTVVTVKKSDVNEIIKTLEEYMRSENEQ